MADFTVKSAPRISRQLFHQALLNRSSPATLLADELFTVCEAWKIDPACALGFFVRESHACTKGYAVRTLNWGNLRMGPGEYKNDGKFAWYASWVVSLNDFCRLLSGRLYDGAGLKTVGQITPRYAPAADNNNPPAYAAFVNQLVETWERLSHS